jgi:hypothetical protein
VNRGHCVCGSLCEPQTLNTLTYGNGGVDVKCYRVLFSGRVVEQCDRFENIADSLHAQQGLGVEPGLSGGEVPTGRQGAWRYRVTPLAIVVPDNFGANRGEHAGLSCAERGPAARP